MLSTTDTFRALRHKNFKLFFIGQLFSLVGTWMQQVALGWLVYRLTHSALMLGAVSFASQIPVLFVGWWGGVVADRLPKRNLVAFTQFLSLVQAAVLAWLTLTGRIQIWEIMALSLMLGVVNAFDMPTRQSLFAELVDDRRDLPNAIALNSTIFNAARLIGPSIAGITVALYGEGICFVINSVSFLMVIGCLLLITVGAKPASRPAVSYLAYMKEGIVYAWNTGHIRTMLLLVGLTSIAGTPYTVLMPIFAGDILKGGPDTLGYLMGMIGLGALAGALSLARRNLAEGLEQRVWKAVSLFGGALILFSLSTNLWLSLLILPVAGFGLITHMVSTNTILQSTVPDELRGRVMSFYSMMFVGLTPIGSLIAGTVSHGIGVRWTVAICGVICLAGGLVFRVKSGVRSEE